MILIINLIIATVFSRYDKMDIYDPGLMAANGSVDGSSTPTGNESVNKTELDQNVEKLVGNISSWWSGFAKKSQDSITQARKEMETRGGIVNYAKSEYAKLESSIGEAQKKARDHSQQPQGAKEDLSAESSSTDSASRSEVSKGKQRAIDNHTSAVAPSDDAEGANQGPTLGASMSSLFSKLTSDPRLVQLQHSLTSTLQSVSSPVTSNEPNDATRTTNPIKLQESLSKLSLTIQSHLPHLDLKESQQLANRYLQATESFAREVQSDMKEFVGELVRIVPPEERGAEAESTAAKSDSTYSGSDVAEKTAPPIAADNQSQPSGKARPGSTDAKTQTVAATDATSEEEDFAWDEDDEEAAAVRSEIAVSTTSSTGKAAEQLSMATTPTVKQAETVQAKNEESEEDSDWE